MILLICINRFAIFVVYLQQINCILAIEAFFITLCCNINVLKKRKRVQ